MHYKTVWICNLTRMDRFWSKLMPSLMSVTYNTFGNHTSLLQNLYITNQGSYSQNFIFSVTYEQAQ
jgi:hypothetical protein